MSQPTTSRTPRWSHKKSHGPTTWLLDLDCPVRTCRIRNLKAKERYKINGTRRYAEAVYQSPEGYLKVPLTHEWTPSNRIAIADQVASLLAPLRAEAEAHGTITPESKAYQPVNDLLVTELSWLLPPPPPSKHQ